MKKILFFQGPDYRDINSSFERGEPEKYAYQKKLTNLSASFLGKYGISDVCVISLLASSSYDQVLTNGVRAVGLPISQLGNKAALQGCKDFLKEYAPDNCIIQVPSTSLVSYCSRAKVKSLVMIADSFTGQGVVGSIRCLLFANALNNSFIEVVSNHNYPASRLLKLFGVSTEKIIPWDHPWDVSAYKAECRVLDETKKLWKLFFAGRIIKEKGVGDIIRAVSLLKRQNYDAEAVFAGNGRIDEFKKMAAELDVADKICFLGNIAHEQVINNMKKADVVVVPSRIQAGEGMPCTIYEAMLARTPLVLSTHPMFKEIVEDAVFFKAGNAKSLAKSLTFLMRNRQLYNDLSSKSEVAVKKIIVPFSFGEIVDHWLSGTVADRIWLKAHNLKNRKTNS